MSTVPSGRGPDRTRPAQGSNGPFVIAGVLVVVSIVFPLWVGSYAKDGPRLGGFPFFYWYQLMWVFIAAILLSIAYRLVVNEEHRRREARRAARGEGEEGLR